MRHLIKVIDVASSIAMGLAAMAMAGIVVLVAAEILSRGVFNSSIIFAVEWATYLQGVLILLGAAFTLRTEGHIRVGIGLESLPKAIARRVDFAATVVGLGISGVLAYAMADLALDALIDGTTSAWPSQTPLFVPQLAAAIGALLFFLQLLGRLLGLVAGIEVSAPAGTMRSE